MKAIDEFFGDLKQKGVQKDFVDRMQSRKELYELLNYTPGKEWYYPEVTSPKKWNEVKDFSLECEYKFYLFLSILLDVLIKC